MNIADLFSEYRPEIPDPHESHLMGAWKVDAYRTDGSPFYYIRYCLMCHYEQLWHNEGVITDPELTFECEGK